MGIPFESLRLENTPLFGNVIALFFFAEFPRCFPVDCIVGCLFVRAGTFSELDMVFWVMNEKALEIFGYHDGVTKLPWFGPLVGKARRYFRLTLLFEPMPIKS